VRGGGGGAGREGGIFRRGEASATSRPSRGFALGVVARGRGAPRLAGRDGAAAVRVGDSRRPLGVPRLDELLREPVHVSRTTCRTFGARAVRAKRGLPSRSQTNHLLRAELWSRQLHDAPRPHVAVAALSGHGAGYSTLGIMEECLSSGNL